MAQNDMVLANQSGLAFRSDLNNALAALVSQNSGAAQPSTTYAYQVWADTTAGLLKIRNAANNGWISLYRLDGTFSVVPPEDGAISTAKLADGALAASAAGLLKMADGYLAASAAGRAKMADGFVTSGKIEDGTIVNGDISGAAGIVDSKLTGTTCKAWVNFNGTGTVAIRASHNVSSITDNGTGDYTVNFTTALADANYAASVASEMGAGNGGFNGVNTNNFTTTTLRFSAYTQGGAVRDISVALVAVFR